MWTIRDLPPGTMVTSEPRLLPMNMSESVVLPQSGFVLISVTHFATKDHIDAQGMDRKKKWKKALASSNRNTNGQYMYSAG